MTFEELQILVDDIKCPPFKIVVGNIYPDEIRIILLWEVICVLKNTPKTITIPLFLTPRQLSFFSEERMLERLRLLMYNAVQHEVDEQFLFKGQRIYYPHHKAIISQDIV